MPFAHTATRLARRALDLVLVGLILLVLAVVAVARVVPALTGAPVYVVGGGSMEPTIPLGAAVIDLPVTADQLAVDDIVSVQVGEEKAVFTHRIIRVVERDDGRWIQTKGDANEDQDPSIIPATTVIGRVAVTIPYAGYALKLLSTGQGVMFVLAFAVLVLAGAWLLESLELDQGIARRRLERARTFAPEETAA